MNVYNSNVKYRRVQVTKLIVTSRYEKKTRHEIQVSFEIHSLVMRLTIWDENKTSFYYENWSVLNRSFGCIGNRYGRGQNCFS